MAAPRGASVRLASPLLPRLGRRCATLLEEASKGDTPQRLAKEASLPPSLPGSSPAKTARNRKAPGSRAGGLSVIRRLLGLSRADHLLGLLGERLVPLLLGGLGLGPLAPVLFGP